MRAAERARIAREQGNEREATYWQSIADLVATAPPLSPEQKARLQILLHTEDTAPTVSRQSAA
ncbi:hypothetical protein [Streptomyces torulosus]|uniref:hypothetical protein n=1 Tax=Streptomyces torulosus TaxID=68276 RepID=UPI0006EB3B9C|nr:hypothetical protein [Streptomyces torulosus]